MNLQSYEAVIALETHDQLLTQLLYGHSKEKRNNSVYMDYSRVEVAADARHSPWSNFYE